MPISLCSRKYTCNFVRRLCDNMDPINNESIHKVLFAYRNIFYGGDNTRMWNYLHENGVSCSKQTVYKLMSQCKDSRTLWLNQLINAIRLQLDFWFDLKLAHELLTNSKEPQECLHYFIDEDKWQPVQLSEIDLLKLIYEDNKYNVKATSRAIQKSDKLIAYVLDKKALPPKSLSLFSIDEYYYWINQLNIDWTTLVKGYQPNPFAHEDTDEQADVTPVHIIDSQGRKQILSNETLLEVLADLVADTKDKNGGINEDRFLLSLKKTFNLTDFSLNT